MLSKIKNMISDKNISKYILKFSHFADLLRLLLLWEIWQLIFTEMVKSITLFLVGKWCLNHGQIFLLLMHLGTTLYADMSVVMEIIFTHGTASAPWRRWIPSNPRIFMWLWRKWKMQWSMQMIMKKWINEIVSPEVHIIGSVLHEKILSTIHSIVWSKIACSKDRMRGIFLVHLWGMKSWMTHKWVPPSYWEMFCIGYCL